MRYAFISGDRNTKFEPLAVVYSNGKYEFICESHKRQRSFYDHIKNNKYESFDRFLSSFSYQNVETGEVTPDVESLLNTLRARFALSQIADQELETGKEQDKEDIGRGNALLRISKRMRNGTNEQQ